MFCTPSRNRPHRVAELLAACRQMNTQAPFEICVDPDDPQLDFYHALPLMPGWRIWVADRPMKVCDHLRAFYHRHPDLSWYGIMGDDALPRTPYWDQILINIAQNDAVSYPNDIVQMGQCTHPVIGGDLMRAVGWFVPDGFIHWFCDTVWEYLAWRTRRLLYCREVIVEHICPRRTDIQVPDDETSLNLWTLPDGTRRSEEDDKLRWQEFIEKGEADAAIARIIAGLGVNG